MSGRLLMRALGLAGLFLVVAGAGPCDPNVPLTGPAADGGSDASADAGTDASSSVDLASQTGIITGRACNSAADCGSGYACIGLPQMTDNVPGGYCLLGSAASPAACRADAECPTGTYCSPLPNHQIPGVCLRGCNQPSDCRPYYSCGIVTLYPGTDLGSPSSSHPVCWVDECTPGQDQTCNDDPAISSLHGMCTVEHLCYCKIAGSQNPQTGRCY